MFTTAKSAAKYGVGPIAVKRERRGTSRSSSAAGAPSALDDFLVPRRWRYTDLGPTPYFAALFAVVNIHHYFMDFVIWRKDNPRTRYLLRS